ncbi:MAG: hypothetical protein ABIR28_04945, partial [Vicinamibacteria bacterium]
MNDFNSSASVRRLATVLNRRFGVWVASPSVALLSALVAGKGRPKRLLVELGVPPFVSNIARIAGATPVHVPASQVRPAIRGAVVTEGLSPDLVWVTAVHREGHLAETEWLTEARSHGVPSVEICLGSLGALMTVPERLASFTIVQLDAERTLDGLQLTALLTDDSDLADRVRQLCLPGPGSADYVLDASPRGVTYDEPALLSLLDASIARAQSPAVEEPLPPAAGQGFDLSWSRRFQDEDGPVSAVVAAPPPSRDEPGKNPWLMRFAEAEARQAQAVQSLTALRSQFESEQAGRARVNERLQLIEKESAERGERLLILQAERDRLKVAALAQAEESDKNLMRAQTQIEELETNAIFNSKERAELLEQKNEVARQLSAAEKERATLSARAEALERDQAKVEAAREKLAAQLTRAEAEIQAMTLKAEASERDRKELKKEATSHNERAVAAEAARMALATQIARFESEVGTNDQSRNHLLDQKAVVEGELALARAEAGALKSKIEGVEAR